MTRRPVAIVTSTIPLTVHKFHRELLRQLGDVGYDVVVVSSPGEHLESLEATAGVRTAAIPMTRSISPRSDLAALRAWRRLLRLERPALIVTATPKASLLGQVSARLTGVRRRAYYLGGLRLEGDTGAQRAVLTAMERLTIWCAHVVITNSSSLAEQVRALRLAPPHKVRTILPGSSHGVDSGHFSPREADARLRAELGLAAEMPVLGFIGRVTADKGVEALIEAVHLLAERGREVQVLVVGSQDESDATMWLDRLKGESRVAVVGHIDDVRPYIGLVDLHVLPSRREGFPNVVLETAAMGVPTVTTRATGAVDSVRHGETGLLVGVDDAEELAAAVARILDDPELKTRLGRNARCMAVTEFQPQAVVSNFVGHILAQ